MTQIIHTETASTKQYNLSIIITVMEDLHTRRYIVWYDKVITVLERQKISSNIFLQCMLPFHIPSRQQTKIPSKGHITEKLTYDVEKRH